MNKVLSELFVSLFLFMLIGVTFASPSIAVTSR